DDRPDQPGVVGDGDVQEPAAAGVRRPHDARGRRRAGAGRDEPEQQLGVVPGDLLARVVHFSSGTAGWIAIGAAAGAAVVAVAVLLVWLDSRRGRAQRESVLGDTSGRRDLVDFAITLQ